jgi:hypothetical protein
LFFFSPASKPAKIEPRSLGIDAFVTLCSLPRRLHLASEVDISL